MTPAWSNRASAMFLPRVAILAVLLCAACASQPVAGPVHTAIWDLGTPENEPMDRDWIPSSFFGAQISKVSNVAVFEATSCKKAFEGRYGMLAIALVEHRGRPGAAHYLRTVCAEW